MLSVKNVTKIYQTEKSHNDVVALNDVSIDFPETGFVFLLGKSGSGKSTLLNVIGGLDVFDKGEIVIKGKSSKAFTQSDFDSYRNTFIGFIFQEYNILENFTVAKNLALAIELQGKKAKKEEVNRLLEQVEMLQYANRKPNQLSGGQKQRVAIARALIKNPEIIMADEPTGALDSNTGKQVMDTLKELSKTKLVIVVSHDRDFAEIYGDRIIELKDGVIISDVTKKEIESKQTENGVKIIDDSILYIKKGQQINEAQMKLISDFIVQRTQATDTFISFSDDANEKFKESASINDDGNREKFVDTTQEDIKIQEYNPNSLKLIKSRLKFADSFKIGTSSLKHKVGRLIFTILLSFLAFTVFGIVDALSCWNRPTSVYQAMELTGQRNVALRKRRYVKNDYRDTFTTQTDIDSLKNKFPDYTFKGVVGRTYHFNSLNYDGEYINFYSNSDNPYYNTKFNGFIDITQEELDRYGFTLEGNLPANKNEICISKHMLDVFGELTKDTDKKVTDYSKITLRIGYDYSNSLKVVGVIDDKTDLSNLKNLDDDKSSDNMLMEMYRTMIDYGFSCMGYVHSDLIEEFSSEGIHAEYRFNVDGKEDDTYYISSINSINDFTSGYENYLENQSQIRYENKNDDTFLDYYKYEAYWNLYDGNGNNLYRFWKNENRLIKYNYDEEYGYYLGEEDVTGDEYTEFFATMFGGDLNDDYIPDDFVMNDYTSEYIESLDFKYIKNNGTLVENGKLKNLGKNEIIVPSDWLGRMYNTMSDCKTAIDNGLTVTLKDETRAVVETFTIVGIVEYGNFYVSEEIYNEKISSLFNGYNYIVTSLLGKGSDSDLIKYCETYDENNVKFVVQNGTTNILDMLEDIIVYAPKIFLYIAIGFAVFAAILLMNFISTSIAHKKREIGVLRALGARGSDIFGIFLNESTVISLINCALASIATFVACYFINIALLAKLGLDIVLLTPGIRQFALILAISWGSAFIASFIPSMKISKKKPIDAINNR